jgi:hypothetical protein
MLMKALSMHFKLSVHLQTGMSRGHTWSLYQHDLTVKCSTALKS